ncbi:ice-binding family protein [Natronolimnobius baerhuensis]|uniref:ice-binding family protein n=1 Tax=Natronolimnobius baerhuensis TaxID=253108 RepID=UPI001FE5E9C3|nr:ice-binding family protein [Natronolimnobius baerhuensis]
MEYNPTRRTVITSSGLLTAGLAGCIGAAQEDSDFPVQIQQDGPAPVDLGTACDFSILAKSGISSVPNSDVAGDIGVSPIASTAITGFDLTLDASGVFATSTQVGGRVYAANYAEPTPSRLTTAVSDMETAFTDAYGRVPPDFTNLGGGNLDGETLTPGVYSWDTGLSIDGDITLDGGPDDTWIFQVAGDLTVASGATINLTGGAQPENIVWVVAGGGGVEIGTDANFAGVVLAQTAINVLTNATVDGCLYAQTAVNLQMATVTGCDCDLVDLQVDSACVDEDGEITVSNPNDVSVMVTVTGPDAYEETMEVPAGGSATWGNLADGTYSLETDNIAIGLDITTLDISCDPTVPDVVTTPATDVNGSTATLNGELTDLGDFATVDVFFEWRELGADDWIATAPQTLDAPGDFSDEIAGLEPGTTYEFRAVGLANGERVEGATLRIIKEVPGVPEVITSPATDVNGSTATLNGELLDLGEFDSVDVFFEWRELGADDWITTETQTLDAPGEFSAEIPGLEPGETYEFRAVAVADGTRDEGAILSFTKAEPGAPIVETQTATDINGSTATLNGELIDLGDFDTVDVFFEWRELGEDEWIATETQTLDDPGDFTTEIAGLEPGTTYEFRAVAVANGERYEGTIVSFTKAEAGVPSIETQPATDVNGSTATLNAELLDLGEFDTADVFFEWREVGADEWIATEPQTVDEPGEFSAEIEGLESGSTYEFRAVMVANGEQFLGATLSFTKFGPDELDVETRPATDINGSTATLNGELIELGDFDSVDVFFEWREVGADEWNTTETQTLDEPGDFSAEIEGLQPGSTYEFRAVAVSDGTRDEGAILSFTKAEIGAPIVETQMATDVNGSTATLNAELIDLGEFDTVDVFFEWREVGADDWITTETQTLDAPGDFSTEIAGLEPGNTYEFRAVAVADGERYEGTIVSFTKAEVGAPSVETQPATDINGSTATLNAELIDLGDFDTVDVLFEWREVGMDDWIATGSQTLGEPGEFSTEIAGLELGSTYEFRAVVVANGERFLGATLSFTKFGPAALDVETRPATDINGSTATLNGELLELEGAAEATVFFLYRVKGTAVWTFTDEAALTEPGPFSATAMNLETGTTYEFQAVAQVGDTVVYGSILEFTKEPDKKDKKKKKREYKRAKREYEKCKKKYEKGNVNKKQLKKKRHAYERAKREYEEYKQKCKNAS